MVNMWKAADDPSRCDFVPGASNNCAAAEYHVPLIPVTIPDTAAGRGESIDAAEEAGAAADDGHCHQVPLITTPVAATALQELSRRESFDPARALAARSAYVIESSEVDVTGARNFVPIQDKWDHMLECCRLRYSPAFWTFFLKLHSFAQVVVDTVLHNVKKMEFFPPELQRNFPSCRRNIMNNLGCIQEFWSIVRHTHRIDLSQFNLPSGTRFLDFEFVDPIWGWLLAARRHHPGDLHWKPIAQHRTKEPLYGGGIQYGECFKHAFMTCRAGSYLMMMGLHWDGTYGRSLDVTPIAVAVANINNCDKSKETCIGYMPFTPDQKRPEFKKTEKSTRCLMWCSVDVSQSVVSMSPRV